MNDSAGPCGLTLPLALATEMAARTASGRAQEISAATSPAGRERRERLERRAARRRAKAVRR
jgi:hypothetical protein